MSSSSAFDNSLLNSPNGFENVLCHVGRALLGLYFFVPGVMKVLGWDGSVAYMAQHGVPLVVPLLALTIVLQIGGGAMLAIGYQTRLAAFVLAGLTLMINLFMHDFWNDYEGGNTQHELQNFIKNLGIFAGLLYVAGTRPVVRGSDRHQGDPSGPQ